MRIKATFIAGAALCALVGFSTLSSGTANAASIADWGAPSVGASGSFEGSIKARKSHARWFMHDYTFTASEAGTIDATLNGTKGFGWAKFKLMDGKTTLEMSKPGWGKFSGLAISYASLEAGKEYVLRVFGKAWRDGSYAGSYELGGYEVSPVPLPGAAVLFGSGLLSLAAIRRRKRAERCSADSAAA